MANSFNFNTSMWNRPWNLKEGFLIGGGLIIVGLILELSIGPVSWDIFVWPANCWVLVGFLLLNIGIYSLRKRIYAFNFLGSFKAAIPSLAYAVVLTIIMGLTRQIADGTGLSNMLTFWPFVLTYVYLTVILSQVILRRLTHFRWQHDIPFMLNHLGLFIALTTATLGNADMQRLKMVTALGEKEWRGLNEQGEVVKLPITIQLDRFIMETYDDGTPRRFASEVQLFTTSGKHLQATVDVNKPLTVEGWKIYQYGYDTSKGAESNISILELVHDPWLPAVYTGIYMMLMGAVSMFILGVRRKKS